MMKSVFSLFVLLSASFIEVAVADQAVNWSALPADAAIAVINGKNVSKADFTAQAKLWVALFSCRKTRSKEKEFDAPAAVEKHLGGLVDAYVFQRLFEAATNLAPVVITAQQRASQEAKCVSSFTRNPKGKFSDLLAIVRSKGVEREFLSRFETELKYEAFFHANYSNEYAVTEQDVDKQTEYLKFYNENATRTNALTVALANKIIGEARAGADFAELAKKWSFADDKPEGGDMGDCFADDFPSEKPTYWSTVSSLKPGEVSDLLETDEGYEIVKNIGTACYTSADGIHLARVFLRRAMMLPMLPRDELREELKEARMNRVKRKAQMAVRKQCSLKFPYGKNVFKTWKIKE